MISEVIKACRLCVFCKIEIPNDSNSKYCTAKCRQKKYTSTPESILKRHDRYKKTVLNKYTVDDLDEELWKQISGYEKYYISNVGRVKHIICGEKIVPQYKVKKYQTVRLRKDKKQKTIKIHELVAFHFVDNPRKFKYIRHIDKDLINNNMNNLKWYAQLPKEREKVKITTQKRKLKGIDQVIYTVKYTNSKDVVCIKQFDNKEDAQTYILTCKPRYKK